MRTLQLKPKYRLHLWPHCLWKWQWSVFCKSLDRWFPWLYCRGFLTLSHKPTNLKVSYIFFNYDVITWLITLTSNPAKSWYWGYSFFRVSQNHVIVESHALVVGIPLPKFTSRKNNLKDIYIIQFSNALRIIYEILLRLVV